MDVLNLIVDIIADSVIKELISKSKKATEFSYCPYSKYPVGAALLTSDGTTYTGNSISSLYI